MIIHQLGDILLYRDPPNFTTRLIIDGEKMEDPGEGPFYYHVAICIDAQTKIEAQGKDVAYARIDDGGVFDTFRPPIPYEHIQKGIYAIRGYAGQPYDWSAIVDDAFRYLTRGLIHLPTKFVLSSERHRKICSTLAADYLQEAKWAKFKIGVSPQDIYESVKEYRVRQ